MEPFFETARECWSVIHSGGWPELGWWSYLLLALLVATEGPVSTLLGAAAAATGILDIRYVFFSAFLGNVLGDCLWYSVGYVNDLKRIHRFGSWFGMRSHHVDRLETEMHAHATKLIALSKLAVGLIIPTLVAAGLARVPWRRWFPLVLLIEITWTMLMVGVGFQGAGLITQLERGLQLVGIAVLVLVFAGIIWYGRRYFSQSEDSVAAERLTADSLTANEVATSKMYSSTSVAAECIAVSKARVVAQLPYSPLPVKFTAYKRNAYKQLMGCLSATRLSTKASSIKLLTRRSTPAKSVLKRSIVGNNPLSPLSPSRPPSAIQIHFAGD